MTVEPTAAEADHEAGNLELRNIVKRFEKPGQGEILVLDEIDVDIPAGSFVTLIGQSGCGKTTLMNIVAGLVEPDAGSIKRDGESISPEDLSSAYIFQEDRLLNWKTVAQNVEFALMARNVPKSAWDERVEYYLEMVGLLDDADTYPTRLSGGMKQRVSIARALATEPDLLLMDEPFSSLDELTARELREELLDIWSEQEKTVLFVTHNINEAVFLSDYIYMMGMDGKLHAERAVDIDRPRSYDDEKIAAREAELYREFVDRVEA